MLDVNLTVNASVNASVNATLDDFDIYALKYSWPVTTLFCVAYAVIFIVGVTGNCFVVSVVYRSKRMRSPMNMLIANLACADLLVNVLCLPFNLVSTIMDAWVLGWLICKTVPYLQGVSVSASVYTLVIISLERCLAICYPMTWQMTSRVCRRIVCVIWLFSLTVTSPWVVYFQLYPMGDGSDAQMCVELWPDMNTGNAYFVIAHLLLCYLLPLTVISLCYRLIWRRVSQRTLPGETHTAVGVHLMIHRSKVKVVKMLFIVITLFACSWLPLYAVVCRIRFGGQPTSALEESIVNSVVPVAQWLGASNSCINPILYAFLNRKFRVGFRAVISSQSCCTPLHYGYDCAGSRGSTLKDRHVTIATPRGVVLQRRRVDGGRSRYDSGGSVDNRHATTVLMRCARPSIDTGGSVDNTSVTQRSGVDGVRTSISTGGSVDNTSVTQRSGVDGVRTRINSGSSVDDKCATTVTQRFGADSARIIVNAGGSVRSRCSTNSFTHYNGAKKQDV